MALELPQNSGERLSQVLPTVKCSTCGKFVALSELSGHICSPLPPPSPSTPRTAAILAKIRRGSLSKSTFKLLRSSSIQIDPQHPQRTGSPPQMSQTPVGSRVKQPHPGPPPSTPPPPLPGVMPGSMTRQPSSPILRSQTPLQSTPRLPPLQIPLPASPAPPSTPISSRFDTYPRSSAGQSIFQIAFPVRAGTPGVLRPSLESLTRSSTPASRSSGLSFGGATAPAREQVPSIRDKPSTRTTDPLNSVKIKPNFNTLPTPRSSSAPSVQHPIMERSASASPSLHSDREIPARVAPPLLSLVPERAAATFGPPPLSPLLPMRQPGGAIAREINMAGVGRRGFHAAVQAAMAATYLNKTQPAPDRIRTPTSGMDGRRNNIPTQLNINADVPYWQASSSLSPNTPASSHSPQSLSPHSPHSPNAIPSPSIARSPSAASTARLPSPFSQRFNKNELEIDTAKAVPDNVVPPSPSNSEYSGLAYDHGTESSSSPASPVSGAIISNSPEDVKMIPFLMSPSSPKQSIVVDLHARSASSASSYSYASRNPSKSTSALDQVFNTLLEETRSPPLSTTPLSPQARSPKLPTRSRTAPTIPVSKAESSAMRPRLRQCTRCNKVIEDGRWIRSECSGLLCEFCWKMMYLPKCRGCNQPIERHAISSADGQLKGKYHRECFSCCKCQQPFPDKEFYVFDGKPYCRYHYHEANCSLCSDPECGQPIEGACAVTHSGERYHPEHLLCEFRAPSNGERCHKRLEEYWEVNGRMLCELHMGVICGALPKEADFSMPNPFGDDTNDSESIRRTSVANSDVEFDFRTAIAEHAGARDSLRNSADIHAMRRRTQFIDLR